MSAVSSGAVSRTWKAASFSAASLFSSARLRATGSGASTGPVVTVMAEASWYPW